MNTLDLIAAKTATLPAQQQAEILRYVLALSGEPAYVEPQRPERTQIILQKTWGGVGTS